MDKFQVFAVMGGLIASHHQSNKRTLLTERFVLFFTVTFVRHTVVVFQLPVESEGEPCLQQNR